MKKGIPLLIIGLISLKLFSVYATLGKHSAMYFHTLDSLNKSGMFVIFGLLFLFMKNSYKGEIKTFIMFGVVFSFLTAFLHLYPLLSTDLSCYIFEVGIPLFSTWCVICFALFIYYIYCLKGKLLA